MTSEHVTDEGGLVSGLTLMSDVRWWQQDALWETLDYGIILISVLRNMIFLSLEQEIFFMFPPCVGVGHIHPYIETGGLF